MIKKIDHLAIAVSSLREAAPLYSAILGSQLEREEIVEEQGVRVAFFAVGDAYLELLEPLEPESVVGRFLAKRGPGIHHLALEVVGLDQMLVDLKTRGIRLIDETPRVGADNHRIAFIHPSSTGGVLVELSESLEDSKREET